MHYGGGGKGGEGTSTGIVKEVLFIILLIKDVHTEEEEEKRRRKFPGPERSVVHFIITISSLRARDMDVGLANSRAQENSEEEDVLGDSNIIIFK